LSHRRDASASVFLVDLLKTLKTTMDYKTLSKLSGIPVSTLTRYLTNKTLPRGKNINSIIEKIAKAVEIESLVRQKIFTDGEDFDVSEVVADNYLIRLITMEMTRHFAGYRFNCLLAVDRPGITIATAFGIHNMKKVYYCLANDIGFTSKWREIRYRVKGAKVWSKIYIPVETLKESVLIVSGVLDNTTPLKELRDEIIQHRGEVVGVFTLVSTDEFQRNVKPYQIGKVVSIVKF